MVLQANGMDPKKDVTFMTIGGAETSITAMRNGMIHARAFNPDAALIMKKQGFTELAVLADLGAWPWAGYSTSDALLTNRRDKLKRWTRAMVKSLQLMQTRPEETYKIAQAEFKHPRDITEGAANICIKAIDPRNPGRRQRRIVAQQYRPDHHPTVETCGATADCQASRLLVAARSSARIGYKEIMRPACIWR